MMKRITRTVVFTVFLSLIAVGTARSADDLSVKHAQSLFTRFAELAHAFDPALANLYADDARIVSTRKYSNGTERTLEMQGTEYKALIRQAMPIAKARGDVSTYSDLSYQRDGTRVRIRATRYSILKQYSSPYTLLVGPGAAGQWLIYEERSITRP
jgi:ketosteroid isomerase-like protein